MADVARVAVIGCGWWSTFAHLPALVRNPDAAVVAVADPDDARRAVAAETFDVPAQFRSEEELLDGVEIDAAVVAVPHAHHYACARLALERDVHVLLEKPMVLEVEHGRRLVALARQRGVELVVGYPWNYNVQVLRLREQIAAGRIGEIEHVACLFASIVRELYRGNPEPYRDVLGYTVNAPAAATYSDPAISGGGQAQTQVTHSAALLLWLTGLEAESVAAFTERFELAVDLADVAAIRFRGGALGSLGSIGSVTPGQEELLDYRVFGRDGHIAFDVNQGTASIFAGGTEALPPLASEQRYPHWAPSDNLVQLALGRGTNGSPPELGFAAVALVEALYRSAAAGGGAVTVEPL